MKIPLNHHFPVGLNVLIPLKNTLVFKASKPWPVPPFRTILASPSRPQVPHSPGPSPPTGGAVTAGENVWEAPGKSGTIREELGKSMIFGMIFRKPLRFIHVTLGISWGLMINVGNPGCHAELP